MTPDDDLLSRRFWFEEKIPPDQTPDVGVHTLLFEVVPPDDACPDCGVAAGQPHAAIGCDVARCLVTGGQRLTCRDDHDCGEQIWTGRWPGHAECEEFGWWAYHVPGGTPPWQSCTAEHPGAVLDLNRLDMGEAVWDRSLGRWVLADRTGY